MALNSSRSSSGHNASATTATANMGHGGQLLCWGCGEFGQHSHGHANDVNFRESEVKQFASTATLGVISHIACGASHCVAVTEAGEVYVWGNGHSGQLGSGDQDAQWTPTPMALSPPLPKGSRVRSCACGSRHTMLLLDNGHVYSCGNNFYAQLGYSFRNKDYKENQIRPHLLDFLKHRVVRQVACGDKHSLFLFDQGAVAAVGNNAHGQIGDGSRDESGVPKTVELNETVISISCGPNHNLVITDDGEVYAWGYGKACGRRRHDVLSPVTIPFKGKHVSKVAGGSTHSLALTAGGKVYAWGFGMDGQLGLGSIIMATRPKRLRHSFLDKGASSVACGDSYSAVVTVSGRLYMWGRNSHTIEEGKGSLHKVAEPLCMNPEPNPIVRHVVCGAWHAAALTGQPDFVPLPEDSDSSDDDAASVGAYSRVSSASSSQDESPTHSNGPEQVHLPSLPGSGNLEVSAPPLAVRSADAVQRSRVSLPPPRGQPPEPVAASRAKTKMTIGEFYAMTDSNASSEKSEPAAPPPAGSPGQQKENHHPVQAPPASPTSSGRSKPAPLVVEVPSAELDSSESDDEHPHLPAPTAPVVGGQLLPGKGAATYTASGAHSLVEPLPLLGVAVDGEASSSQTSSDSPAEWAQNVSEALEKSERKDRKEEGGEDVEEGVSPRGRRGGGGTGGGKRSELGHRSRTTTFTPTVRGGRTPVMGRERSVVVSRNLDILDASQLLTGAAGGSKDAGRLAVPYGSGADYLGFQFDAFPFTAGFYDFDDFDSHGSPRHGFSRDTPMQHVPTHQLEGDFGVRPDEMTSAPRSRNKVSRSLSALSSRDLAWIDHLLLQKVVCQGPVQVKRSSSFFGALSGQVSRSPTKFFRKPTPTNQPHRAPVSTSTHTPTSHTPTSRHPLSHPSPASAPRPGTRNLGVNIGGGGGGPKSGGHQGRHLGQGQGPPGGQGHPMAKPPVFSSAASWRQRAPGMGEDLFDDATGQSPPNSSKQPGRKHVAFADDRPAPRPAKPTLADAVAASPPVGHHSNNPSAFLTAADCKPAVISTPAFQVEGHGGGGQGYGSGVQALGQVYGVGGQMHGQDHSADHSHHAQEYGGGHTQDQSHSLGPARQGEGQSGNQMRLGPAVSGHNNAKASGIAVKQTPTLSYRIFNGKTKKDSNSKTPLPISPRSGGSRTLISGTKRSALTSLASQGRTRTQLVVSGSAERNRKAHFD